MSEVTYTEEEVARLMVAMRDKVRENPYMPISVTHDAKTGKAVGFVFGDVTDEERARWEWARQVYAEQWKPERQKVVL